MAKEITYERHDPLAAEIARYYVAKDPDLSHITIGELRFVRVVGKKSNKIVDVKGIQEPMSLFTDFKYMIIIYADSFDSLSEMKQNLFILHALTGIGEEFDGKMRTKEIQEYSKFVERYGAYWHLESDEELERRSGGRFKKIKSNTDANVDQEKEELAEFLNSN